MVDDIVRRGLEKLDDYLHRLEEIRKLSREEFVADWRSHDAALRNLQTAIEICLDLGSHLISESGWKRPDTYVGIIEVLAERGVLPEDFVETAKAMARFRNVLVHEYIDLDLQLIYETLQRLEDIRKFAEYIVRFLKATQPSE